jgi:meso-butanediol dehydrogenase/(S,S)-butanediol dehydrogenase/diacetyl reductase
MRFQDKRVFVTGAASGIGAATVELLRGDGAIVYGVDVSDAPDVHFCDVTDGSTITAAMDAAVAEMGGLDILVNVAGVNWFSKVEDITLDLWQKHLDVNLTGPMLVTQAALPHLRTSKGNIVTVASISGIQGQPYNSSYCASKAGLLLFMKAIAVELAADGIRVNCVCPGGVDTAMSTNALSNIKGEIDFGHFPKMMGVLPGMMPPVKIAEAIAFLASDAASTTTGASLVVDNGTLWQ